MKISELIEQNKEKQPIVLLHHGTLKWIVTPDKGYIEVKYMTDGNYVKCNDADAACKVLKQYIGHPVVEVFNYHAGPKAVRSYLLGAQLIQNDVFILKTNIVMGAHTAVV